jgi:uncharacterized protein YlxW (UPF0749 family)
MARIVNDLFLVGVKQIELPLTVLVVGDEVVVQAHVDVAVLGQDERKVVVRTG